ncbi:MAG: helix-turn-helix transcriptional regulator [Bacteroidota bacterium]
MQANILKVESISQIHDFMGFEKPKHPLVTVVNFGEIEELPKLPKDTKIVSSFYFIALKSGLTSPIKYGRGYYDFQEGTLYAMAPEQVMTVEHEAKEEMEGWGLYFHPDLIRQYPLNEKIKGYGFFSYENNEALHLSDKEKVTITSVIEKIVEEYEANIDEFSQDVLVANIDLLLSYIQRYYSRQFITRKTQNSDVLMRFESLMREYFGTKLKNGLPLVSYFAEQLNLSASYLSDLLKKETGKTAQEHIHYQIIEKAKNLLLNSNATVSEISYDLGFEYPQYFSKIFKKKTGVSPLEFRTLN